MTCRNVVPFWINNTSGDAGLNLSDIFCFKDKREEWHHVLLSGFTFDLPWVFEAAPCLSSVQYTFVILSGQKNTGTHRLHNGVWTTVGAGSSFEPVLRQHLTTAKFAVVEPSLPFPFGTHHSKFAIGLNRFGVRVAIFTANYTKEDWYQKRQGIFVQDFPFDRRVKGEDRHRQRPNDFSLYLHTYLSGCGLGERTAAVPGLAFFSTNFLQNFDFRDAAVRLVGSFPGVWDATAPLSGLGRLASVLKDVDTTPAGRGASILSWQFSSHGKLPDPFLNEVVHTMGGGRCCLVNIVYPTETEVRRSAEGWAGGLSIPITMKNWSDYFNPRLYRWCCACCEKETSAKHCLPHIKSYALLSGDRSSLYWCLMTSANLSQAAWGMPVSGNRRKILSYELGVVYTANSAVSSPFTVTLSHPFAPPGGDNLHWTPFCGGSVGMALPYNVLHPVPYDTTALLAEGKAVPADTLDVPWVVDLPHRGLDSLGRTFSEVVGAYQGGSPGLTGKKRCRDS
ncbi:Tyrosyl-DNA phosphodiesterase, putative [Angomonas deanei]|uniref:Tyrosyl-DNA phosphodiesterase, putative n=1 Tax=Angomonas deanei TaxID=59799 RepID=A0A7G2CQY2_9TRYP|nr:Tyrosyl-DNA phosphodiesterase, putative [Angomonas deanei]